VNYPRSIMKDYDMPLLDRVEAALARVKNRQCLMRIPVEATDMDVVVSDCGEEIKRLRVELAQRTAERDEAVDALKRIATYDYRGNQSGESQIARHALIAMRKQGGGA